MGNRKLSDEDLLNFARDVMAGLSERELSQRYDANSSATLSRWRGWCEELGYLAANYRRRKPIPAPKAEVLDLDLPKPTLRLLRTFSEDSLISGDLHVPGHDCLWVDRLMRVGKKEEIKKLGIIGDYHDTGAANPWGRNPNVPLFAEVDNGIGVVEHLHRQFETIVIAGGNHERWLRKFLNWEGGFPDLLSRMKSVAQWSSFEFLPLGSDHQGKEIMGVHGTYRRVPGSSAREISEIELQHIIHGHTHALSFSYAKNGQFWAIDNGHLCDERRFSYKAKRKTTHPEWVSGFTMLRDGFPTLFGPHTDWSRYD